MSTEKTLDVSGPGPTAGAGMAGLTFLSGNNGTESKSTGAMFSETGAPPTSTDPPAAPMPEITNNASSGAPAVPDGGMQAAREPKADLNPVMREDFSAEAMEEKRRQEAIRRQQQQQRAAAYDNVVRTYNEIAPTPPDVPFMVRYQHYAMWATLSVLACLVIWYFIRGSMSKNAALPVPQPQQG